MVRKLLFRLLSLENPLKEQNDWLLQIIRQPGNGNHVEGESRVFFGGLFILEVGVLIVCIVSSGGLEEVHGKMHIG